MNENSTKPSSDEIDLIELIKYLWDGRWLIVKITAAFIALGLVVALTSPLQYKAEARLLPEVKDTGGGASSLLRQFGGLGGLGMPMGEGADAIGPMLYPDVLKSTPFFKELLEYNVSYKAEDETFKVSVYEYLNEHAKGSFFGHVKKYTIRLPWTIIGWFRADKEADIITVSTEQHQLPRMTKEQFMVIIRFTR